MNLIEEAEDLYQQYDLDHLPEELKRNSLKHYYLSVYPAIKNMNEVTSDIFRLYPKEIKNIYIHTPYCTGACDFCSYMIIPIKPEKVEGIQKIIDIEELETAKISTVPTVQQYYQLLKKEILFHRQFTHFNISYLYFGGGSPNLIPKKILEDFFNFLNKKKLLNQTYLATIELHPEFFDDLEIAQSFLTLYKTLGINRVSIGYQSSDDMILADNHRRHDTTFLEKAVRLLRENEFCFNIDLMYGLPNQSLKTWEATLHTVLQLEPDSISTYFLFLNKGTKLTQKVEKGEVCLPSYHDSQVMRIMAQLFLKEKYLELPNDFFAKIDERLVNPIKPYRLPSDSHTLPVGVGAYGYYNDTQLCNEFNVKAYQKKVMEGQSPLWRFYSMNRNELLHRDIMFSFKNDPYLDVHLFQNKYGVNIIDCFQQTFFKLEALNLIEIKENHIMLTDKGCLSVEEIACQFEMPMKNSNNKNSKNQLLEKYDFKPRYNESSDEDGKSLSLTPSILPQALNENSFFARHKTKFKFGVTAALGIGIAGIVAMNLSNNS